MAKQAIALRLDPELIEWLDGYAKQRGVSRQVVLEGAVKSFRGLARGGVPDLEPAVRSPARVTHVKVPEPKPDLTRERAAAARKLPKGVKTASELAMDRMRKMNPERYGGGL